MRSYMVIKEYSEKKRCFSQMVTKAIRFVVIGLGMGGHYCIAISNVRGTKLAAVCDKHPVRLEERASVIYQFAHTRKTIEVGWVPASQG